MPVRRMDRTVRQEKIKVIFLLMLFIFFMGSSLTRCAVQVYSNNFSMQIKIGGQLTWLTNSVFMTVYCLQSIWVT